MTHDKLKECSFHTNTKRLGFCSWLKNPNQPKASIIGCVSHIAIPPKCDKTLSIWKGVNGCLDLSPNTHIVLILHT